MDCRYCGTPGPRNRRDHIHKDCDDEFHARLERGVCAKCGVREAAPSPDVYHPNKFCSECGSTFGGWRGYPGGGRP